MALNGALGADHVYAAALVNGRATVQHVLAHHPGCTLLIICAGSVKNVNIEDMYGAGYLVDMFEQQSGGDADLSDAARVALALYRHAGPEASLLGSRVGRICQRRGHEHEVRHSAQLSVFELAAELKDGRIVRAA